MIHLYFVSKQILEALQPGSYFPSSCPQCQDLSFSVGKIKLNAELLNGYAPLLDGQGAPNNAVGRASVVEGDEAV